ncbi:MAG: Gfo/Idh/MocA family oxidoreductase, partial [Planctomycetales bacterium]|nr:Gfo/Idh/MocA family oxidoreductase [Planctomycetales bacterium]
MLPPVRFGVVGYGLFGRHHAATIAATPGADLVAVSAKSAESRATARDTHPDVDVYGDFLELIARDDIDIVDIVVPNHLHHAVGRAALEAGKHVLIEKPMALSVADCNEVVELGRRRGLVVAVNHELRHSSLWGGVKRLIDEGAIGRPQHALVELSRFPYRQGSEGWRWDSARVGDWILEEPIHFFDLARWYMSGCGEPVTVYARANSRHAESSQLRDNFSAIVTHDDGAYAVVSQTLAAFEHHVTAKVAGERGTIWARWSAADARSDRPTFALRWGLGDEVHDVALDRPTGELLELADQIAMMVDCVRHGTRPLCSSEDG